MKQKVSRLFSFPKTAVKIMHDHMFDHLRILPCFYVLGIAGFLQKIKNFFSLITAYHSLRGWAIRSVLFRCLFQFRNFRFHRLYQFSEFFFTFLSRRSVVSRLEGKIKKDLHKKQSTIPFYMYKSKMSKNKQVAFAYSIVLLLNFYQRIYLNINERICQSK